MAELNCPEVEQYPSIGFGLDMLSMIFEENNYFHDIRFESLVLSYSSDIIIQIDNIISNTFSDNVKSILQYF